MKLMRSLKRIELVLAVAALAAMVPAANAQLGLYGAFTGARFNGAHVPWMYGGTFGGYYDGIHFPVVNFGLDLRFAFLGGGGDPSATTGLAGPRAVLHLPVLPIRPYGEVLAGAGHVTRGEGFASTDETIFDYGVAAGLDATILPRIDWRVVDYQHTWSPSGIHQSSLSSGLVLRIPLLF